MSNEATVGTDKDSEMVSPSDFDPRTVVSQASQLESESFKSSLRRKSANYNQRLADGFALAGMSR